MKKLGEEGKASPVLMAGYGYEMLKMLEENNNNLDKNNDNKGER